jgi:hypothetical protein
MYFFFCKEGLIERKGSEVKKTDTKGGILKIYVEIHLSPVFFYLLSDRSAGPLNFIKFNFDTEIHFTYFQFFLGWRRERRVLDYSLERECLLVRI